MQPDPLAYEDLPSFRTALYNWTRDNPINRWALQAVYSDAQDLWVAAHPHVLTPNQLRWLAALRSGDYEAGTDYLHCEGRYTALGVAAEIFHPPQFRKFVDSRGCTIFDGDRSDPPNYVLAALDIDLDRAGWLEALDYDLSLSEIADQIEANKEFHFK